MHEQYLSMDNINPKYWGKCGWKFLNSIALTYKPEYKENYKLFFSQLQYILPCLECGAEMKRNMYSLDEALTNKETLLNWLLGIRNHIYKNQNRPTKILKDNFDEIFENNNSYKNTMCIIALIVILLLLIFLFYYNKKVGV
jgi:hypothetical protein